MRGGTVLVSAALPVWSIRGGGMVSLSDEMMLYHGSYVRIDNIEPERCAPGKDFGRGYYLASDAVATCADMTPADMIMDYSAEEGKGRIEILDSTIESGAYDALYDDQTGLWALTGACRSITCHLPLLFGFEKTGVQIVAEKCMYRGAAERARTPFDIWIDCRIKKGTADWALRYQRQCVDHRLRFRTMDDIRGHKTLDYGHCPLYVRNESSSSGTSVGRTNLRSLVLPVAAIFPSAMSGARCRRTVARALMEIAIATREGRMPSFMQV